MRLHLFGSGAEPLVNGPPLQEHGGSINWISGLFLKRIQRDMVWEHIEVGDQEWKVGHDFKKYAEYIYEFF